ncbi:hypothetical protein V1520DRAFT_334550 [Lipomyces starkeyi]|uniref:TauD/TfdA-like domain-containing protein n=1 Tax=Lipomyces starkeyi NRRL Y-11557 TaxID=675824 RepID=A0A1E3Q7E6_LIPST|nr:hypothetical protein LIPSTDRAFT_263337 [Lipomyces starkeyi NRRL Y-11557]
MSGTTTNTVTVSAPDVLQITPLENAPFGARIILPAYAQDPADLNEDDFQRLYKAVHEYLVVVLPDLAELKPSSQYQLTKRFDPTCEGAYGHSKEFRHEKSVLRRDGHSTPAQPQVQILGQGRHDGHAGVPDLLLRHPTHMSFHHDPLSDDDMANGYTRFYRWHIDSALYGLAPPVVTTLLGIDCPVDKSQKIRYEDTGEEITTAKATTAFASGAIAFDNLSDEDKEFALNTTVVYAPHPYIFISPAKATSDGLTMVSEGKELPLDELPEWEQSKVKRLPLVWTNPVSGKHHMQVHGCCIWKLETPNGTLELEEARNTIHRLMRPNISPDRIYCHDWNQGDLVIFFNRGVWHSVTGQFEEGGHRLMHQCNIASAVDPVCKK